MTPTKQTYDALQRAYDHFNRALFDAQLPACMITLQRKDKRVRGYFHGDRFKQVDGELRTDEIAMNPQRFLSATVEDVLSTLAHEMVHSWQAKYGKPSRTGYHNRQWAEKMKALGLQPTHTGQPGGKETGQTMTHYVVAGGAFALSCATLITKGLRLEWGDPVLPDAGNRSTRVKYTCPTCGINAWGKPDLLLLCGLCVRDCGDRGENPEEAFERVVLREANPVQAQAEPLRLAA